MKFQLQTISECPITNVAGPATLKLQKIAYKNGYARAFSVGRSKARSGGYKSGYAVGRSRGYKSGYRSGLAAQKRKNRNLWRKIRVLQK